MGITFSDHVVTAIAGAALIAGLTSAMPPSRADRPPTRAANSAVAATDSVVRYWTPARMMGARLTTTQPNPGGGPVSTAYPGTRVSAPSLVQPKPRPKAKPKAKPTGKTRPTGKPQAKAKPQPKARAKPPVKAKHQPEAKARLKAKAGSKEPAKKPAKAPARTQWLTGNTAGYGLRWTHGGAVEGAVGKVFFTLGGLAYACTGALVSSKNVEIVLTAAHCVSGGRKPGGRTEWAADWLFVPGYRDGKKPYGEYTARRFFISPRWTGPSVDLEADDVAFVQVGAAPRKPAPHVPVPPSGLLVKFAAQSSAVGSAVSSAALLSRAYVFGFPQEPPYTGLYPNFCAGAVTVSGGSVAINCGMTAGDSGGPWFGQFSPRTGTGTIMAVTTYKLAGNMRVLYGAVLGPLTRGLYQRASTWR